MPNAKYGADSDLQGWCNPLLITFTEKGKGFTWENSRGAEWGLHLYKDGPDYGLTFKIKLLKTIPNQKPVAIGSNPMFHPAAPKEPGAPKKTVPSYTDVPITFFQPTLPAGPPSSAELIVTMINASLQAIREANSTLARDCYSSQPPFYEGITLFGKVIASNDTSLLRWHLEYKEGLTLGQISSIGLCLLGPQMLPPSLLFEVCNQTLAVNDTFQYVMTSNDTYLACSSGLTTFIVTSTFLKGREY
jgi:hypothetical protein